MQTQKNNIKELNLTKLVDNNHKQKRVKVKEGEIEINFIFLERLWKKLDNIKNFHIRAFLKGLYITTSLLFLVGVIISLLLMIVSFLNILPKLIGLSSEYPFFSVPILFTLCLYIIYFVGKLMDKSHRSKHTNKNKMEVIKNGRSKKC